MATVSSAELSQQVASLYIGSDRFYGALLNAPGLAFNATTTFESILQYEISYAIGGYLRQEFFYTNADLNTYSGGVSVDTKQISFTHSASPATAWSVTHVAIIRSASINSSTNVKSVLSTFNQSGTGVDITNNRITVSNYSDLADGYKVVIEPPAGQSLPTGISGATIYYVKLAGGNEIELYTNPALTTIVDITGVSAGTALIRNANGSLFGLQALLTPVTISGTQTATYNININQGS